MKLTRRQEEFIQKMLELRREFDGPIHYSLLAERLGVSPFTAYDMLCLLEEKGYMTSEYQLPPDKSGPGRAERVFYPVESACHGRRAAEASDGARLEGQALKKFVLDKLRKGETPDNELTEQILARIPSNGGREARYCLEVMVVAALRLGRDGGQRVLLERLPGMLSGGGSACKANLSLLGGFVFGLLAQQSAPGQEWLDKLLEHIQGYLDLVIRMDPEDCNDLAIQMNGMLAALAEAQ